MASENNNESTELQVWELVATTKSETRTPTAERDSLREAELLIRKATDAMLSEFKIKDVGRPQRGNPEGIVWGWGIIIDRLEWGLESLRTDAVGGSISDDEAITRARELVRGAVLQLRPGAHFTRRIFSASRPLAPVAELGLYCAIVEHLAEDIATVSEKCGWGTTTNLPARIAIRSE